MKKTITLNENELISLIERMVKEEETKLPCKTVGELKKILLMANPNGFLIMVDGDNSNWITSASHLNVETYGYRLNGVDITKDNKFVGLPYYEDACLADKSKRDYGNVNDDSKMIRTHKQFRSIKEVIKQLEQYSDNDYLMLFDGSLVSDIKLNGSKTVGFKSIYGSCETFKSRPNDFVFLVKGEKTNSFFRRGETNESVKQTIKEYGEDSGGQDMTYGIYKRDNKGLGQSIDFRMMSPMNVALEIEDVLPEKYIDTDVERAVDNYIEDSSINIEMANKYMKDEDWWDTLYYNIKDVRDKKNIKEETGTASAGAYSTALDQQPIRRKIRTGLTKEEFFKLKEYMDMDESLSEGKKKTGTKLCARGKAAAKAKFKIYPSAYSSGYGVQVCKGRMPGLDGKKRCSGAYC
jgi:hypothetical protein